MADADQQQAEPCSEVAAPFESTAAAVSQLFREHNRALLAGLANAASEAVVTVGNGGHFLSLDRPRELTDLIIRFMAS